MNEIFKNFSFTINDSTINGEKATVGVTLTNTDFSGVVKEMVHQAIKIVFYDFVNKGTIENEKRN